ncbi:hypothetical protein [Roseisalinus antarcticus]|uniref:Uncharacterized protein n=1 Tax=Roseisalinus antarcticus TaxID=254357 RepID=A0A1Y5U0E5_9RHOB|nr:hypothetical protein [Roseisalinus antarcticus]SLN77964.1 hypothetical protein ROA7023_04610 [Roseisalinus antarcticus]
MNLLVLLLRLPWWSYFGLAALVVWAGSNLQDHGRADAALAEAALASPPPTPTNMSAGTIAVPRELNEVALRAQIVVDQNTELVTRTNGIPTARRAMFVLVAPEAVRMPDRARGFFVVPWNQRQETLDWMTERMVGMGALGPIVKLEGLLDTSSAGISHVRDVMSERGHPVASNPFFLEPFLDGREAGLAQAQRQSASAGAMSWVFAGLIALFGIIKRVFTVLMRREEGRGDPGLATAAGPIHAAPQQAPVMSQNIAPGSPIDRIRARQAGYAAGSGAQAPGGSGMSRHAPQTRSEPDDPFSSGPIASGGRLWHRPRRTTTN